MGANNPVNPCFQVAFDIHDDGEIRTGVLVTRERNAPAGRVFAVSRVAVARRFTRNP